MGTCRAAGPPASIAICSNYTLLEIPRVKMALPDLPSLMVNGLMEQLQARFPANTPSDPSSPISMGIAALERRTSNRSSNGIIGRASGLERSRTASPRLGLGIDTASGIRSTASSPGLPMTPPSRRAPPPAPLLLSKMRPPSELFLPTPKAGQVTGFRFSALVPENTEIKSPDLPLRAATTTASPTSTSACTAPPPLSPISSSIASAIARLDVNASVQTMFDNLSMPEATRFTFPPLRSSTAPPSLRRTPSFLSIKSSRSFLSMRSTNSLPSRASCRFSGKRAVGSSSRGACIKALSSITLKGFSGIDKDIKAEKRIGALKAKNRLSMVNDDPEDENPPRPVLNKAATFSVIPWRKKKRGETMSMLLDTGFFPVSEYIYDPEKTIEKTKTTGPTKRKELALKILVKDLPAAGRPSSMLMTPTNFYAGSLLGYRRSSKISMRRSTFVRSRPTESISNSRISPSTIISRTVDMAPLTPPSPTSPLTPSKALAALTSNQLLPSTPATPKSGQPSPGILEVIHEDNTALFPPATSSSSQSTSQDPSFTPEEPNQTTEIHLNTGTTLTIVPPEQTPYRRSIYLQGPIKLSLPPTIPRKNSIATMEAFQPALNIPRRQSEDAVVDDTCTWLSSWNFSPVAFAFDTFSLDLEEGKEDNGLERLMELPESPIDTVFRFSSTLQPTPVAQEVAVAMLGIDESWSFGKGRGSEIEALSMDFVPLPELPKAVVEEAVKRHSRESSGGSGSSGWVDANSRSGSVGSRPGSRDSGKSGMGSTGSVEEEGWESKDTIEKRDSGEVLKAKPKMSRMRRYLQTASAIL